MIFARSVNAVGGFDLRVLGQPTCRTYTVDCMKYHSVFYLRLAPVLFVVSAGTNHPHHTKMVNIQPLIVNPLQPPRPETRQQKLRDMEAKTGASWQASMKEKNSSRVYILAEAIYIETGRLPNPSRTSSSPRASPVGSMQTRQPRNRC